MKYSNAGHTYPILYRKKQNRIEQIKAKGAVIGIKKILDYEEKEILLETGDRILLYTDGLTEAMNENFKQRYGKERLYNCVHKNRNNTLKEFIDYTQHDLNKFIGNFYSDDVTFIGIDIK